MIKQIDNTTYGQLLARKRVVLVCPSKSIESSVQGEFIDGHDIVVRLNNGYNLTPYQQTDFGSRTDLVYHYLSLQSENQTHYDLQKIKDSGTKVIVIPPRQEKIHFEIFLEKNQNIRLPFLRINDKVKMEMWDEIGCLAFCGIWAVIHLLKFPLTSLQIIGMNFFTTGHYTGYDNRTEEQQISYAMNSEFDKRGIEKQHHITPQKELLRKLYKTDTRLILDETTKNAIYVTY